MRKINFSTSEVIYIGEKSDFRCGCCGTRDNLHIHHIIPLKDGGNNSLKNLILLCEFCHKRIHSGKEELYLENKYYKEDWAKESFIHHDKKYSPVEIGWDMSIDSTDHFQFNCPKCKCEVAIKNISLKNFNTYKIPPCFYFHLKCPKCRIKGQRKIYLNKIKEGDGKTN